ncbi:MAG: acryloyl-CoA reductase [Planctomycetota bacterium]|nr:acryloyl-CoA reductase [Planctomycetota bacterium]
MQVAHFPCMWIEQSDTGEVSRKIHRITPIQLPEEEVLVRVDYSSLNYKDALAASGHPGVVQAFPHVPGIDAAGEVVVSDSARFSPGQAVFLTGYELGAQRWGGWSRYVRVPADWLLPLPQGLTLEETMIYGTAGLTAALSVDALRRQDVLPSAGEVLVTGATGGVGSLAILLLAGLGYQVVASTGKPAMHDALRNWGAAEVVSREELAGSQKRPLLSERWAGAVDTVGGTTLASVLKATRRNGCVAACGLVGGVDWEATVYPFILRGVTLAGIDSAWCPLARRQLMWSQLAQEWKPARLAEVSRSTTLDALPEQVDQMLAGQLTGRWVVSLSETPELT